MAASRRCSQAVVGGQVRPSLFRSRTRTLMSATQPCVYMLATGRNGTLYTGVTTNLLQRVWQHREEVTPGFTRNYGVHHLVWFEVHETISAAIIREKAIKRW